MMRQTKLELTREVTKLRRNLKRLIEVEEDYKVSLSARRKLEHELSEKRGQVKNQAQQIQNQLDLLNDFNGRIESWSRRVDFLEDQLFRRNSDGARLISILSKSVDTVRDEEEHRRMLERRFTSWEDGEVAYDPNTKVTTLEAVPVGEESYTHKASGIDIDAKR